MLMSLSSVAFVPQISRYICQSLGLQQFCPTAQPSYERRCSLQRYHLGEMDTKAIDMGGNCSGNEENVCVCCYNPFLGVVKNVVS